MESLINMTLYQFLIVIGVVSVVMVSVVVACRDELDKDALHGFVYPVVFVLAVFVGTVSAIFATVWMENQNEKIRARNPVESAILAKHVSQVCQSRDSCYTDFVLTLRNGNTVYEQSFNYYDYSRFNERDRISHVLSRSNYPTIYKNNTPNS